jgi:hypothetical protein
MSVRKLSSEHFENCEYFGDKIVIHKCVIEAAIKRIKNDPDPFGDGEVQHGQISILEELRDLIVRGQNIETERIMKRLNKVI